MTTKVGGIMAFIKDRLWEILSLLFVVGVTYGSLKIENNWRDQRLCQLTTRLDEAEKRLTSVERLVERDTWSNDLQQQQITSLSSESRQAQATIGKIEAQIAVINSKLDAILEVVKGKSK